MVQAQRKEEVMRSFDTRSFDGFLERFRRRRPKSQLFLPIFREAVRVRPQLTLVRTPPRSRSR